ARSGDRDAAVTAVERLDGMTQAAGTDWALGLRARSRALISEGDTAEEHHREAVERLGRTRSRVELARAHLVFGEWLRRENRRRDARTHLRTAHTMLTGFGAGAFTDRAARELLATGEKAAGRRTQRLALTPQEARIAGLARDALTNPEIGAQLFLSPHTVEWHPRKVFTKLGVTSRRHLRTALAAHDPATPDRAPTPPGCATRGRAVRLTGSLVAQAQRLPLSLLDLLDGQARQVQLGEGHLGAARLGVGRQPLLRLPGVGAHQRLRAVRVDLLDLHHDRGDRRSAHGSERREQIRTGRDTGTAVDAQRGRAARNEEDQSAAPGPHHVLQGVEPAVAGRVGDRQRPLVQHRHEPGRAATRRHVGPALGVRAADEDQRGTADQRPGLLGQPVALLAERVRVRLRVELAQLLGAGE